MPVRTKTDRRIQAKRESNDLKVLKYLTNNVSTLAIGRLESPEKLTVFYAGYTAMRSLWEARTQKGKIRQVIQPSTANSSACLDGSSFAWTRKSRTQSDSTRRRFCESPLSNTGGGRFCIFAEHELTNR